MGGTTTQMLLGNHQTDKTSLLVAVRHTSTFTLRSIIKLIGKCVHRIYDLL